MNLQMQLAFLRRYGFISWTLHTVYRVLWRTVRYRALRCMTLSLENVNPSLLETPGGLFVKFLSATEFGSLPNATQLIPEDAVRERAQRGDWACVVLDGERIAAYGWYSHDPCPIDEVYDFHFDRRFVYMYDGFTDPAYRGRKLHAVGMAHAVRKVTAGGSVGLVSYVEADNFASLRSVKRLGYEVFGSCRSLRLFGADFAFASSGCRARHVSLELRASRAT